MELDSLASVRAGAQDFLQQSKILNVLIDNAGVMATLEGWTKDGFRTQFGANHRVNFLLFELLKPTLLASATPEFPFRAVSMSSIRHRSGSVRLHNYDFDESGSYSLGLPTAKPRPQNIWCANEIERRYGSRKLHATSLRTGGIVTSLQKYLILKRQSHGTSLPHGRT